MQRLGQSLGHFLADNSLAILHFGDMALRDAGQFGKLPLRKVLTVTVRTEEGNVLFLAQSRSAADGGSIAFLFVNITKYAWVSKK